MSREKQTMEMACAICGNSRICVGEGVKRCLLYPQMWRYANNAYREGYRKQSEIIDEFAERLKEAPIKCALPLLGLQTKDEIEEYFNDIMLQVQDAIDSISKEMKGSE